jgi:hypothetical protein
MQAAMRIDEFIERLRVALSWESATFSQTIRSTYNRQLSESVDAAVAAMAKIDPSGAEAAHLLLHSLTPAGHLDFVSAPHIASLIISPALLSHSGHRKFFLKSLGICAGCVSDDAVLYDHRGVTIAPGAEGHQGRHGPGSDYAVSFDGELPIPYMDRGGNRLRPIAPDTASVILGRLNAAERLIKTINTNTSAFSIQQTEVLAFRFEDEYPTSFCSGSFKTLPGFSLITNCLLPSVNERDLADAIVHEAIHAIICRFEAFGERLLNSDIAGHPQVGSPWTGARLGVESFAQACFVWFGLHHFWKNASDDASLSFDERATKGFVSSDFARCCRSSAEYLSPGVASRLEELARHL